MDGAWQKTLCYSWSVNLNVLSLTESGQHNVRCWLNNLFREEIMEINHKMIVSPVVVLANLQYKCNTLLISVKQGMSSFLWLYKEI